jgi:hypothetical protein
MWWDETDFTKCDKIRELKLSSEEWERVNMFLGLLSVCSQFIVASQCLTLSKHANNAQQSFSSKQVSTLHLAIPALEALHKAWSSCAACPKYEWFVPALHAAFTKIDDYYEKTTETPAYIMAMSMQHYFLSDIC